MKNLLFFFTFFLFSLHASEELVVRLETQKELAPLYIEAIPSEHPSLSAAYLNQLNLLLKTDVARSGLAYLSDRAERVKGQFKWSFEKGQLILTLQDLSKHAQRTFRDFHLTGVLNIDRQKIHKMADQALHFFFGQEGIFSHKILFATQTIGSRGDQKYLSEIWQCDYDGANLSRITHDEHYAITPIYFPSGSRDRFFYVGYKEGPPKIYISSLTDSKSEPLIRLSGNQLLPSISKDGRKMAFVSDAGGRADLFLQLIDPIKGPIGKPMQIFSAAESVQASSSFSPDGNQLVFVSDKDGSPRLYMIDLHHLQQRARPYARCLTMQNRENTGPSWSPDGKKIAYSAKTNGIRQIWIYDVESHEERQLTFDEHHKENPCFAPNSLHLVYNTTDAHESELYIINLNDPFPIRITSGPGKKHYPSWEP